MQLTKRRKNSIFTFVIRLGGVAQLVERLNGIQEVRGSTPLISTTYKKNEPDYCRVLFLFRGLCAAMPCRLRREPLRAGAAFMRVNSLTSLLRKRCLLRPPLISTTYKKKRTRSLLGSFFVLFQEQGAIVEREREGKTSKRFRPFWKNYRNSSLLFLFVTLCHAMYIFLFCLSCLVELKAINMNCLFILKYNLPNKYANKNLHLEDNLVKLHTNKQLR